MNKKPKRHLAQATNIIPKEQLLKSGCTVVDLALSGRLAGGWVKGFYYFIPGDSDSGKTWLMLGTLAEACKNPEFDDYDLVFVNAERGVMMDIKKFFGSKLKKRLEIVETIDTADALYHDITDRCKEGRPFVMVVDSESALSSIADDAKYEKTKGKIRKGQEAAGSFGDGKAKIHSQNLRRVCSRINKTGSIVLMIGQSRDNIAPMSYEKQTHSGGRALKFYAAAQCWTSKKGSVKTKVFGKDRQQGTICQFRTKKNRIVGKDRSVKFTIYHSFGLDDVGSNIDFLLTEGWWKKSGGKINAKEFSVNLTREALIEWIESDNEEAKLRKIVASVWNEIEAKCAISRKPRYE